jgi:hypothetical protein
LHPGWDFNPGPISALEIVALCHPPPGWDFNPGPISALEIVALCHPPPRPLCQWPFFLYTVEEKRTPSEKQDMYKFIGVT